MRLLVSGWRDVPHSYSLVNAHQLAALRVVAPDLDLRHRDLSYLFEYWQPRHDLLTPEAARRVQAIPAPESGWIPDLELSMGHPPDLTPRPWPHLCFTTAEWGVIRRQVWGANAEDPIARRATCHWLTPSRFSRQGLVASGCPPEQVHVLPHGVDTATFRPVSAETQEHLRRALNLDGGPWLLSVGAMTGNKGIGQLLFAFARLLEQHPRAGLMLKGSDDLYNSRQRLEQLLRERLPSEMTHRLLPRLRYWGGVMAPPELARLYQAADGYASAYRAEAFNLPVLEAMATGLPLICTAGGPTDEFTRPEFCLGIASERVRHEQEGELFFSLQPDGEHLLTHLRTWVEEATWRHQAGEQAHEAAQAYDWTAIAKRLRTLCDQLR